MPPEQAVFFLDRSLGKEKVAGALRAAGAHVEIHDLHFSPDARDDDWLQEVGRRGWVVLTKDKHIRRRATELAALRNARVSAFVLTSGNLTGEEMAAAFVRALKRMRRVAAQNRPPFIATVTRDGSVSILLSAKMLGRKR
jgi:predicted nuclease of predicted toxin-antitoxin system